MKKTAATIGFLSVLLSGTIIFPSVAQNPQFPQTLPANTVVGRSGIGPGPAQAIPFSLMTSLLNNTPNTWTTAQTFNAAVTANGLVTANAGTSITNSTSPFSVATYDGVTVSGKAGSIVTSTDNSAQTALERYSAWFGNTSQGTGDGTPAATTYSIGCSNIKANWTTSTVAGETVCLNVVARGGDNNVLTSGDTSGININVGASFSNNLAQQFEGVSGYLPGGSTTGSLFLNTQIGSVRASGLDTGSNTGIGFFAQAQNGLLGYAFQASNLGTNGTAKFGLASKWLGAFNYIYDDGTHTPYPAFNVNQSGQLTLAGFGAVNTNQKTIRVGSSVTNNLEIVNGAGSAVIASLTDTGILSANAGINSGANGGTGGQLAFNGATSGNFTESVSATGGHIFVSSNIASTLTGGCNGAGSSISGTDVLGTVVGQTAVATQCTVTFGTTYAVAPRCLPTGRTTPVTSYSTSTSTLVINFASTASATFDWICYGA